VSEGENGYLAADDDAWYVALARLGSDPTLRAALGAAGRRRVEREYCVQVTAPRLARCQQCVVERAP
jgi:glycosyltransferase involved in cell wall biosynthesis